MNLPDSQCFPPPRVDAAILVREKLLRSKPTPLNFSRVPLTAKILP
ncbi:hypothetical protein N44_03734 [Microcystis aeruginosa NIES-44]|uniref:Uncharacterized protein n=1 Tax=Microcystis aeruginosa NIES-44 TaxID=449439 RepID=A0A0A1VZA2_MICAE|nr:hypothetical protein N44_03734 [Microcystis aeruginosa NIES-44]